VRHELASRLEKEFCPMKKLTLNLTSLFAIASLAVLVRCGSSPPPATSGTAAAPSQEAAHPDDHAHSGHGAGPHDGTLADWGGGKYHVGFTVDHDKQEATVYVLGDDEKTPSPIKGAVTPLDEIMRLLRRLLGCGSRRIFW
jgi:hypothetical protein